MDCDEAAFNRIVDSPKVERLCSMIAAEPDHKRQGVMKRGLPFFCFHASFRGQRRVIKDAVPSGFAMLDIDGVENPREVWDEIEPRKEELDIVLAHVTPSGKGLRIVFVIPYGLSLVEAQQRVAKKLNLSNVDTVVKDLARCSFAVPRGYILFGPKAELFDNSPQTTTDVVGMVTKESEKEAPSLPSPVKSPTSQPSTVKSPSSQPSPVGGDGGGCSYNGIPYSSIVASWLSIYLRQKPGYQSFEAPAVGDRNNTLYDLCRELRNICDFSFQKILDVVPDFGLERDEVERTVMSALKAERKRPYILEKALSSLSEDKSEWMSLESNEEIEALNESYLERMPPLPTLMEATVDGADRRFHMPIIIGMLPMICSYADKVVFRYADGRWRRPNLMSLIVGPPMSGKSAITSQLAPVMKLMNEESKLVRNEQDEARKKNNEKSDKERGKTFEKFIKKLNMDITDAELLYNQKSANRNGVQVGDHFLPRKQFMFSEEAGVVMKAAKNDKLMSAWRIAFDNGEWGKDAHADLAVSGMVNLSFDFTALCTMGVLQKLLDPANIENGTASRILIGLMPGAHFECMPWFDEKKKKETDAISKMTEKLCGMQEVIDSKQLIAAVTKWSNDIARECEATRNFDKDMLRRRSGIIGQTAAILYALLEEKRRKRRLVVSENAIRFGLLIANYNLEIQLLVFKDYAKMSSVKIEFEGKYKSTRNKMLFENLPETFTREDIMRMKKCDSNYASVVIHRFKEKGLITELKEEKEIKYKKVVEVKRR